jgi:hypothetical protein
MRVIMNQKALILASLLFTTGSNVIAMDKSTRKNQPDELIIDNIIRFGLGDNPTKSLTQFALVSKKWHAVTTTIKDNLIPEIKLQQLKKVPWESLYIIIKWRELFEDINDYDRKPSKDNETQFESFLCNKKDFCFNSEDKIYLKLEYLLPAYAIVKTGTKLKSFLLTYIEKTTCHQLKQLETNPESWLNLKKQLQALAQIAKVIEDEEKKLHIKRICKPHADILKLQLDYTIELNKTNGPSAKEVLSYFHDQIKNVTTTVAYLILELSEKCPDCVAANYQQQLQEKEFQEKLQKKETPTIVPLSQTNCPKSEDFESLEEILAQNTSPTPINFEQFDKLKERFNQLIKDDENDPGKTQNSIDSQHDFNNNKPTNQNTLDSSLRTFSLDALLERFNQIKNEVADDGSEETPHLTDTKKLEVQSHSLDNHENTRPTKNKPPTTFNFDDLAERFKQLKKDEEDDSTTK